MGNYYIIIGLYRDYVGVILVISQLSCQFCCLRVSVDHVKDANASGDCRQTGLSNMLSLTSWGSDLLSQTLRDTLNPKP